MTVVLDANVVVALLVADDHQPVVRALFERWLDAGEQLHAPVTARLQRRHATDSAYVCLARRLDTTLWTLDGALARNAADIGLPVTSSADPPGDRGRRRLAWRGDRRWLGGASGTGHGRRRYGLVELVEL